MTGPETWNIIWGVLAVNIDAITDENDRDAIIGAQSLFRSLIQGSIPDLEILAHDPHSGS